MQNANVLVAGLMLAGSFLVKAPLTAADNVVVQEQLAPGDYCHMKFPAIDPETLGTSQPRLSSGDVIDFYGPCDESPTGADQVHEQKEDDFLSRQRD